MIRALSLAAVLMSPAIAWADDCADAMTTAEMRQCSYAAYQTADAALNAAYKDVRAAAAAADALHGEAKDSGAVHHLREAQRAWIKLRDAQCVIEGFPFRGGTMESVLFNGCLADLTEKRTQELLDLAELLRL